MSTKADTYIKRLLTQRLKDMSEGVERIDTNEVLRIKSALSADRPTADMIMTVIFNQFTFLHKSFDLQSDEEFQSIMRFLEAFHEDTKRELLSKVGTQKEGLAMETPET